MPLHTAGLPLWPQSFFLYFLMQCTAGAERRAAGSIFRTANPCWLPFCIGVYWMQ